MKLRRVISLCLALAMLAGMVEMPVFTVYAVDTQSQPVTEQLSAATPEAQEVDLLASGYCGAQGQNLRWTLDTVGALRISGSGDMLDFQSESAPWYDYLKNISYVYIEDGVTSIGECAFYDCTKFGYLQIGSSVTSIGGSAFAGCTGLTYVTIPGNVKSIGGSAFASCSNLRTVTLQEGVESIGDYAFGYCERLSTINIANSVTFIGQSTFSGCSNLQLNWYESGRYIGSAENPYMMLVKASSTDITDCQIHPDTKFIHADALSGCDYLTQINLPDGLIHIGNDAFSYCDRLATITIPDSVTHVALQPVAGSSSLQYYTYDNANYLGNALNPYAVLVSPVDKTITSCQVHPDAKAIAAMAFFNCTNLATVTIPEGVTVIGMQVFQNCKALTRISIPNSVTSIGDMAFYGCESLTELTIPDSVNTLGREAFADCTNLSDVVFGKGLSVIGNSAFSGCNKLTQITIPDNVTEIGDSAFYNCTALADITIGRGVAKIGRWAFRSCSKLTTVRISDLAAWCAISFEDSTANPAYLAKNLYLNGQLLTALVLPDNVKIIANHAFRNCKGLTSVTIPEGVEYIGNSAFSDCTNLNSVTLGEDIIDIGEYAFYYCEKLNDITIPDSVTSIRNDAFSMCTSLKNVKIGNGVKHIGVNAFYSCTAMTEVTVGTSVRSIGTYAFFGCSSLKQIHISDLAAWCMIEFSDGFANPLVQLGDLYLKGEKLTDLVIPEQIITIGQYAFNGWQSLNSLKIHDGVTTIDKSAFAQCSNLTNAVIGSGLTTLGDYAFASCGNLLSVTIPVNLTRINQYAFNNCGMLWHVVYTGTEQQWNNIYINYGNNPLKNAMRHHDCVGNEILDAVNKSCALCCGHKLGDPFVVTHTDTEDGYRGRLCPTCGFVLKENIVPAGHDYSEWYISWRPSCTESGTQYRTCSICDITETETIPATGHNFVDDVCTSCGDLNWPITGTVGDNLTWTLDAEGTLTISGEGAIPNFTETTFAPWFDYRSYIDELVIENGVTSIGDWAFQNLTSLDTVVIGEGVTSIGDSAFYYCDWLVSITIPASVTAIGSNAFQFCKWMKAIHISDIGAWCAIDFENLSANPLQAGHNLYVNGTAAGNIVIPEGVTAIKKYAFASCHNMTGITIPGTVTVIEDYAFSECWSLSNVTISQGVTAIGDYAFDSCAFRNIVLPEGLTRIGKYAFYECEGLQSVTFPSSVSVVGVEAFGSCYSITSVSISDVAAWCNIKFENMYSNPLSRGANLYLNGELLAYLIIPEGVTAVGPYQFFGCHSITNVAFSRSVMEIGEWAFGECRSLTSVAIPDTVTGIGMCAFNSCTALTDLTLGNGITTIPDSTFAECSSLYAVTIPSSVTSIGQYAFAGCDSLTTVVVTDSVTNVGKGAFNNCDNLWHLLFIGSSTSEFEIESENVPLESVTWHVNATGDEVVDPARKLCKLCCTHNYVKDEVIPPTCAEQGHTLYICSICGHVKKDEFVPSPGHVYGEAVIVPPTCAAGGYTSRVCTGCGYEYRTDPVPPIAHAYGEWIIDQEATCSEPGLKHHICTVCGFVESDTIATVEHSYRVEITEPTCIETGIEHHICTVCGHTVSKVLPIAKHTFETVTTDATCTEPGQKQHTCTVCGHIEYETIPAKGHKYNRVITKPTCQAQGYTTHTCACGDSYVDSYTDKVDHNYVNNKCSYCGDIIYAVVDSGACGDNVVWTLDSFGVLTISGVGQMWDFGSGTRAEWSGHSFRIKSIMIEDGVTGIGTEAFFDCPMATSVTIADSVTSIRDYAFQGCSELISITLPENVSYIGNSVFSGCSSLEYNLYDNARYLGTRTNPYFYLANAVNREDITSCVIADTTKIIGGSAFNYCESMTSVTIPSGVLVIGKSAFLACWELTAVTIPDTVVSIGDLAFSDCRNLKTLYIGNSVATIGKSAFKNCRSLELVEIPVSVTEIGESAFQGCSKLRTIVIPLSITSIGNEAFRSCRSLQVFYAGTQQQAADIGMEAASEGGKSLMWHYGSNKNIINGLTCYYCTECGKYLLPDGTTGKGTVIFKNWNGEELARQSYDWGDAIIPPANPSKEADETYTYIFAGWGEEVGQCVGDATFTANFTAVYIEYTITFLNWNGTVISSETYHYGDKVMAPANPTRPDDGQNAYIFTGWDKTIADCKGDATYTAVYSATTLIPDEITSDVYTVSGGWIRKIAAGTTVAKLLAGIHESRYIKVFDGMKEVSGSTLVSTGMTVKLMERETVKASVTVVVTGDTNGDGKITITDMLAIKSHILKKSTLSGAAALAADTSNDAAISITDFIQIKAYILDKGTITPN